VTRPDRAAHRSARKNVANLEPLSATTAGPEAVARVYSGSRRRDGTTLVSVNGLPLDPRPNFRSQSATTFDWGYEGRGGPAQLALAILADHFADDERARRHYEDFTRRVIRGLLKESWLLTGAEIDAVYPEGTVKAHYARQPMSIPCESATAVAPDAGEAAGRDPAMVQKEKEKV